MVTICKTVLVLASLAATVAGCTIEETTSASASGTVESKGEHVSGVLITLEPVAPTTGPKATVPIFAGKFDFGSELGLHGGKYRVRFSLMPVEIRKTIPPDHAIGVPDSDAVMDPHFDELSRLTWDLSKSQVNQKHFEIEIR